MTNLRDQLHHCFRGRVCLMGLGNTEYTDDGFGVCLAEVLGRAGVPDVVVAGTDPEQFVGRLVSEDFQHIIFIDAVDFRGPPGAVTFLGAADLESRYPQVSTHRLSLALLAKWVEDTGLIRAWLLGVQPLSLRAGEKLTPVLQKTLLILREVILEAVAVTPHS